MKLDKTDKLILEHLQRDARIKQLEEAGIIKRHITVLDPEKLGLSLTAMVSLTMNNHTADFFDRFEQKLRELPEVMECYVVTGQDSDFLIKVVVRDMRHYEEFLLRRLTKIEGVTGVHSSFVLRQPITSYQLPI